MHEIWSHQLFRTPLGSLLKSATVAPPSGAPSCVPSGLFSSAPTLRSPFLLRGDSCPFSVPNSSDFFTFRQDTKP